MIFYFYERSRNGIKVQEALQSRTQVEIVKEGLLSNVKSSELCRFYDIYPADYYHLKKLAESAMVDGLKSNTTKKKVN